MPGFIRLPSFRIFSDRHSLLWLTLLFSLSPRRPQFYFLCAQAAVPRLLCLTGDIYQMSLLCPIQILSLCIWTPSGAHMSLHFFLPNSLSIPGNEMSSTPTVLSSDLTSKLLAASTLLWKGHTFCFLYREVLGLRLISCELRLHFRSLYGFRPLSHASCWSQKDAQGCSLSLYMWLHPLLPHVDHWLQPSNSLSTFLTWLLYGHKYLITFSIKKKKATF